MIDNLHKLLEDVASSEVKLRGMIGGLKEDVDGLEIKTEDKDFLKDMLNNALSGKAITHADIDGRIKEMLNNAS